MSIQVEIQPTVKRAALIVGFAVLLSGVLLGLRSLAPAESSQRPDAVAAWSSSGASGLLLPVVDLTIEDATMETAWSKSLAAALSGRTEVLIEGGRIDVVTDRFAIEVERLSKWHEGLGQALHYGRAMGKLPCLALIVDSDSWPVNAATLEKIELVESSCQPSGVRVILLRRNTAKIQP